ncbi:MAG TPA: WecB/TagA/CpsF family glycosyltransferase [Polyangiaceae bacterium]|jgi:N-acetylglucosaminyldiphosphoundecaprenol N-acetyl-beta-D-mannosaminyltransferase
MEPPERIELLECSFDRVTMGSAVEHCVAWCKAPRASHVVLTANAAVLCAKRRDPELEAACRNADLVVPDGVAVVWASRLAGDPLPERIAGVDFMAALMQAASEHGLRVYFLGAKQEVLDTLLQRYRVEYPGAVIAGTRNGYFEEAEHAGIVEEIRAAEPHMLFVGMPSPFKEVWCERHRERLNVPVIMGVGGSFDVHAGYIKRAPRWLQSLGMEWSWRLAMEPRKMWKRYLYTNTEFMWLTADLVAKRRLGLRRRKAA